MVKTLVVSKKSLDFELFIDGTIEVRPMPHKVFSKETIKVIAEAHQVFIRGYSIKHNTQDLVELATNYFKKNGYEIKDKESSAG